MSQTTTTMICSKCGYYTDNINMTKCPHCGTKLEAQMECERE